MSPHEPRPPKTGHRSPAASAPGALPDELVSYCRETLPHVSRTFALTIPELPEPLRDEVGLAYLLCRSIDTVEDHPLLDEAGRNRALLRFVSGMDAATTGASLLGPFGALPKHPDPHHEALLGNSAMLLHGRRSMRPEARLAVDRCLWDMAVGMTRFPGRCPGTTVAACRSLGDLETYCHVVAGTVGLLLTDLFAPWLGTPADDTFREDGRRFGLGLQLTNVLKDAGEDGARGIAYLPPAETGSADEETEIRRRAVSLALRHLDAGNRYVLALPAREPGLRLFCLWALHLAAATLRHSLAAPTGSAVKVSRAELAAVRETTRAAVADDEALRDLYAAATGSLRSDLAPV